MRGIRIPDSIPYPASLPGPTSSTSLRGSYAPIANWTSKLVLFSSLINFVLVGYAFRSDAFMKASPPLNDFPSQMLDRKMQLYVCPL